jgi:hypothetical protein
VGLHRGGLRDAEELDKMLAIIRENPKNLERRFPWTTSFSCGPPRPKAVMLQFGDILVLGNGKVVDQWPVFSNYESVVQQAGKAS